MRAITVLIVLAQVLPPRRMPHSRAHELSSFVRDSESNQVSVGSEFLETETVVPEAAPNTEAVSLAPSPCVWGALCVCGEGGVSLTPSP